jgi:vacuolar-type H+-ATPase subunit E/Vma4
MSLDGKMTVPEKILFDAKAEADKTVCDAQNSAAAKLDSAQKEADEIVRNAKARAEKEAADIISRRTTLAKVESRKIDLSYKKSAIDSVFKRAGEKLADLNAKDYLALIGALISKYAEEGETIDVSVNAPVSVERVKSLKEATEKALKVTKTAQISGGIIIRNDKFDKDLSFDSLVASIKECNENATAKALFG